MNKEKFQIAGVLANYIILLTWIEELNMKNSHIKQIGSQQCTSKIKWLGQNDSMLKISSQ